VSAAISPVAIARATEQLRQERETFNQVKNQAARWFLLRLVMGYSAIILLCAVMFVASYVLMHAPDYTKEVVVAAGAALFVDVIGLLVAVWKIALNPGFHATLSPVTREEIPLFSATASREETA
jgi:hypothetical protein